MEVASKGLPLPILFVGAAIWLVIAYLVAPKLRGLALFLFFALSARYLVTFFHDFTTRSVVAGQSVNSFVTLFLTVLGLYLCRRDLMRYRAFLPVYAFIGALLVSGIWNVEVAGSVNAIIRQLLFLGTMIGVTTAIDSEPNDGSVSRAMLAAFVVPLLYQLVSIVLRFGKASESDGSVSYIGGYVHEGVFSIMLLTAMVIAALAAGMSWRKRSLYLALLFTALIFANYRTAVLAAIPIMAMHLVFGSATQVRVDLAKYVRGAALLISLCLGLFLVALLSQRMADLGTVLSSGGGLIKPPSDFAYGDRSLLSGRVLIWSDYIYTTLRSDVSHLVFGFGPDSWQQTFSLYAHNVFVSYVYELGFFGVIIFIYMLLHFLLLALNARRDKRWTLIGAHLSYGLLCLGTMPTFTIEGVILY
ncbi:MAG: O-antigen ligase family protein, partial [Devosia sp.]